MNPLVRAVAWMSGTLLSFSLMAIGARELSGIVPVFQTLLFRSVIGIVCISLLVAFSSPKITLITHKVPRHVLRNVFHYAGQYGWFLGIGLLPLAEVFALEFTVPIWTIVIASLFLGEHITARKVASIALGFLGVLLIVRPGYAIVDPASLIVLAAAICYAISHTTTKSLTNTESPLVILFYMCLIQLPIGLLFSVASWVWPVGWQWGWLLVIGLTALSAHYCMAKAMQTAEVTTIVSLDFLRLPLIAMVGVLLYQEQFELSILLGGALMLFGNLVLMSGRNSASYTAPETRRQSYASREEDK